MAQPLAWQQSRGLLFAGLGRVLLSLQRVFLIVRVFCQAVSLSSARAGQTRVLLDRVFLAHAF